MKPIIFIGSSKECLPLTRAILAELEDRFEPRVWDQGLFEPSRYALESLLDIRVYDFVLIILSPDDARVCRGEEGRIPRDNCIFELGLFIGILGRDRVLLFVPAEERVELPTDLLGLTTLCYRTPADESHESCRSAVTSACDKAKSYMLRRGRRQAALSSSRQLWPLGIAVVSSDATSVNRLTGALTIYNQIARVMSFSTAGDAKCAMVEGRVDAAFVDIFSLGAEAGIQLIAYARDRHRTIGFALYGTMRELYELPGVTGEWRDTLQHFWKMPKDTNDESYRVTVEDMVLFFFLYRLSEGSFGEQAGRLALTLMRPEFVGSLEVWEQFRFRSNLPEN